MQISAVNLLRSTCSGHPVNKEACHNTVYSTAFSPRYEAKRRQTCLFRSGRHIFPPRKRALRTQRYATQFFCIPLRFFASCLLFFSLVIVRTVQLASGHLFFTRGRKDTRKIKEKCIAHFLFLRRCIRVEEKVDYCMMLENVE